MKKLFLMIGLTSGMAITAASPALAWRATEPTLRDVRSATRDTVSEVRELRNDIRENSRILLQALRMQTGEQSSYADKQIEAQKRFMDAAQQNDTDRVRQQIRAKAESGEFDPNPDACLLIDLFGGQANVNDGMAQGTTIAGIANARRQQIGASGVTSASRQMADMVTMVNGQDASVRAGTFLEEPTVDMSVPAVQDAAVAFQLRMAGPFPFAPVPESAMNTPEGIVKYNAQQSRMNRQSIIDENWAMVGNMVDPVIDGAQLKKMAEGTPYEGSRTIGDKASELQAIDVMVVRHYAPPASETVGAVQTGVVIQKLHQLTSLMARMQYMQLELQRRDLITQSAILAKMIEQDGT